MHRLSPDMSFQEVQRISMLGLAHVGDGVYELLTRTELCRQGIPDGVPKRSSRFWKTRGSLACRALER